jgi:hypothetical protein
MRLQLLLNIVRPSSRILLLSFFCYVSCYFLMMDWRVMAYDPSRDAGIGESCYYMTRLVRVHGEFTVYAGSTCFANVLFWPLDYLLYGVKLALGFRIISHSLIDWTIWLSAFGLNLLLPFFFSISHSFKSLRNSYKRIFLSLIPAIWYCGLIVLYHKIRQDNVNILLGKSIAVLGTIISMYVIFWLGHNRNFIVVAPIAIATLLGTVWLIVSLPCAWPFM